MTCSSTPPVRRSPAGPAPRSGLDGAKAPDPVLIHPVPTAPIPVSTCLVSDLFGDFQQHLMRGTVSRRGFQSRQQLVFRLRRTASGLERPRQCEMRRRRIHRLPRHHRRYSRMASSTRACAIHKSPSRRCSSSSMGKTCSSAGRASPRVFRPARGFLQRSQLFQHRRIAPTAFAYRSSSGIAEAVCLSPVGLRKQLVGAARFHYSGYRSPPPRPPG